MVIVVLEIGGSIGSGMVLVVVVIIIIIKTLFNERSTK